MAIVCPKIKQFNAEPEKIETFMLNYVFAFAFAFACVFKWFYGEIQTESETETEILLRALYVYNIVFHWKCINRNFL